MTKPSSGPWKHEPRRPNPEPPNGAIVWLVIFTLGMLAAGVIYVLVSVAT